MDREVQVDNHTKKSIFSFIIISKSKKFTRLIWCIKCTLQTNTEKIYSNSVNLGKYLLRERSRINEHEKQKSNQNFMFDLSGSNDMCFLFES